MLVLRRSMVAFGQDWPVASQPDLHRLEYLHDDGDRPTPDPKAIPAKTSRPGLVRPTPGSSELRAAPSPSTAFAMLPIRLLVKPKRVTDIAAPAFSDLAESLRDFVDAAEMRAPQREDWYFVQVCYAPVWIRSNQPANSALSLVSSLVHSSVVYFGGLYPSHFQAAFLSSPRRSLAASTLLLAASS